MHFQSHYQILTKIPHSEIYQALGWSLIERKDHTTQGNLQIQCNPYQITNGIFHRTRKNNFKICMETQKILNSQKKLEKEQSWRNHVP